MCSELTSGTTKLSDPPLYFVGDIEAWWGYRKDLVARCTAWHQAKKRLPAPKEDPEVKSLFPPPAFSSELCAGSRWHPATNPKRSGHLFIISCGGVYGGSDGPGGLFDYICRVLGDEASFLLLDTGHSREVAEPVLRAGLQWVLTQWPESSGNIVLAGFSMGSATIASVGADFLAEVRGLLIVAGQTAGAQRLTEFAGKSALILHGSEDATVPPKCGDKLASYARAAGAQTDLHIFQQVPLTLETHDMRQSFKLHHLWDERWEVQAVVLEWLRKLI